MLKKVRYVAKHAAGQSQAANCRSQTVLLPAQSPAWATRSGATGATTKACEGARAARAVPPLTHRTKIPLEISLRGQRRRRVVATRTRTNGETLMTTSSPSRGQRNL